MLYLTVAAEIGAIALPFPLLTCHSIALRSLIDAPFLALTPLLLILLVFLPTFACQRPIYQRLASFSLKLLEFLGYTQRMY